MVYMNMYLNHHKGKNCFTYFLMNLRTKLSESEKMSTSVYKVRCPSNPSCSVPWWITISTG